MNGPLFRLATIVLAAGSLGLPPARAEVVAFLADGTQARADAVDPGSDADALVLRKEAPGILITRRLPWRQVRSVRIEGGLWSAESLLSRLPAEDATGGAPGLACDPGAAPCAPVVPAAWVDARVIGLRDDPLDAYQDLAAVHFPWGIPVNEAGFALGLLRARKARDVLAPECHGSQGHVIPLDPGAPPLGPLNAEPPLPMPGAGMPLRGITVDAVPVRTRGKADWDALAVEIRSADASVRRLRGTLQATLWGQSQTFVPLYQEQFVTVPGRVERIGTWTRFVESDGPEARLVLPLPRPLPEHDLSIAPIGELQVQLLAPGEGTFEASAPFVPLRQITPIRDRNLVERRTRFFPGERTHDARMPGGLNFRQPTSLRPHGRVFTVQP